MAELAFSFTVKVAELNRIVGGSGVFVGILVSVRVGVKVGVGGTGVLVGGFGVLVAVGSIGVLVGAISVFVTVGGIGVDVDVAETEGEVGGTGVLVTVGGSCVGVLVITSGIKPVKKAHTGPVVVAPCSSLAITFQ